MNMSLNPYAMQRNSLLFSQQSAPNTVSLQTNIPNAVSASNSAFSLSGSINPNSPMDVLSMLMSVMQSFLGLMTGQVQVPQQQPVNNGLSGLTNTVLGGTGNRTLTDEAEESIGRIQSLIPQNQAGSSQLAEMLNVLIQLEPESPESQNAQVQVATLAGQMGVPAKSIQLMLMDTAQLQLVNLDQSLEQLGSTLTSGSFEQAQLDARQASISAIRHSLDLQTSKLLEFSDISDMAHSQLQELESVREQVGIMPGSLEAQQLDSQVVSTARAAGLDDQQISRYLAYNAAIRNSNDLAGVVAGLAEPQAYQPQIFEFLTSSIDQALQQDSQYSQFLNL